jgi:ATP-dependent exoDNAse (exonuclease V) alpha subunit
VVHLQYMPSYILVKLTCTWATPLEGLQDNVIPIEPAITTYRIKIQQDKGHTIQKTVRRRQFPITAVYAFTDYCSQGQTLPYVIVDIGSPLTGTLSLFNLYVTLSRSSGRASIRLLCGFDDKLFMASHDPALVDEDERLENLNIKTNSWYEQMVENGAIRTA